MIELTKKMQAQFDKMCKTGKLFRSSIAGHQVWHFFITGFTKEENPVFRDPESSTHNCNLCNNFIRRYGNIVAVDGNGTIMTIFDIRLGKDSEYKGTFKRLSSELKKAKIGDIFKETFNELKSLPYESCKKNNKVFQLGIPKNFKRYTKEEAEKFGVVEEDKTYVFNHFNLVLPAAFVDQTGNSIEQIMASYRDAKEVFHRGMETISLDTLKLVKDLINQDSLLNSKAHLKKVEAFITLKTEYEDVPKKQRDTWCWIVSYNLPIAKFRNELIGVLCSDLSEGMEINKACLEFNKRVDPANYMKAKAPITKKQIKEAEKFVEENGFTDSFSRRFANIDDIKVSEILHANAGDGSVKKMSIFDSVKPTHSRHKKAELKNLEQVPIKKFMKDILPSCTSVEAFLENSHVPHMVSLTTSNNPESKPIFKWDNNYSWTFNGNLAGKSELKQAVKIAGGKVDGVLRFSILWNEDGRSRCDLDLIAYEPNGNKIYYMNNRGPDSPSKLSGFLDVDMIRPATKGVENITWTNKSMMADGVYLFNIKNFDSGKNTGFKAELEFDGEIYSYEYTKELKGTLLIAEITLKNGEFSVKHHLQETNASREIYGLESNQFHKVNLICQSPNHWGKNSIGNKHYFFMLDGCKSPEAIRSFHNENLIPELAKHRKVLEVLANKSQIEPAEKQLSGLGFNETVRDSLVVKVSGTHKRMMKIMF